MTEGHKRKEENTKANAARPQTERRKKRKHKKEKKHGKEQESQKGRT